MNWVDITIIGIIAFSASVSIIRGFIREALSLVSWVLAFFIAGHFYTYITQYLTYFENEMIRIAVAITILFFATLLVCSVVSYVIGQLVQKTGLSGTDRVLGICFGVLRGILVVAALLFLVDTFTSLSKSPYWTESQLIPHFHFIIRWFFDYIQNSSSFLVQ
ncbi:CvpA family protein [Gilliamella apicola]|uniref:Colicin V production protein n=1 Tax=Gilliamella apicola TaxID=1196095 RepID=A0A242NHE6_9GAMM|nr:CvpA family protein [Gilliamella apicola]OTP82318.1 colicin V production protein [Gilliamella apicola]OTP84594.1 colicin V production protein [Gilliamella apicola]OTP88730.1 colicin V production protein [Gilliamella apicola]OTP99494.1 colicin V production protein [Gilliamella apicola]OTQ11365.1 colicin V production protein [Gilliamella apicola]